MVACRGGGSPGVVSCGPSRRPGPRRHLLRSCGHTRVGVPRWPWSCLSERPAAEEAGVPLVRVSRAERSCCGGGGRWGCTFLHAGAGRGLGARAHDHASARCLAEGLHRVRVGVAKAQQEESVKAGGVQGGHPLREHGAVGRAGERVLELGAVLVDGLLELVSAARALVGGSPLP